MLRCKPLALAATICLLSSSWSGVIAQSVPVEPSVQETTAPLEHVISGGTQVLDASSLANMTSITVTLGTTAIIDVANLSNIVLPGNFTNNGQVYFGSSISGVQSVSLTANNIFNQQGAVLSTALPAGLAGFNNASVLNLNLTAISNIVNAGTIGSAADLNMAAGGSIINALPAGVTGPSPIMQATNNVNLNVSNIVNSGLIASSTGNINAATQLAAQALQNLNITSTAGTWQTLAGSINIRDSSYTGNAITGLSGGNFLSDSLNLNGGAGQVEVDIGRVTGRVSTSAHIAHMYADTSRLVLGEQCLTGDPTYANTGDIEIAGPITISGAPLAIIAGGSIFSTAADAQIVNHGGSVLLVAGANITGGSAGGVGLSGINPAGGTTADITVNLSG
jgi:hypothetical protein